MKEYKSMNLIKDDILEYLYKHEQKELLRFITCGSVDDGKSTLIGRLLYETKKVFEDHLMALKAEAKYKRTEDEIDFSLLVDGLQAEREQGITIDVAYRYFTTDKRKFIIADTPGHEQYTRNMVTGASNAELAIILIDARNGVLTQTRRHTFLVRLLGIKHIIVAINKMDAINYKQEVYEKIKKDYINFLSELGNKDYLPFMNHASLFTAFIPISALKGDNVVQKSQNMTWYNDKTLLEYLNSIEIRNNRTNRLNGNNNLNKLEASDSIIPNSTIDSIAPINSNFRFPVQYVNRPNLDFRGYCGTIVSGNIKVGDEIVVFPSKIKTKVKAIIPPEHKETMNSETLKDEQKKISNCDSQFTTHNSPLTSFSAPMAVTLLTEDEVDISRGDLIAKPEAMPELSDVLNIFVVWMNEEPLVIGKSYDLKRGTSYVSGYIDEIYFKININTLEKEKGKKLYMNEIAFCRVVLNREMSFDNYWENRFTGGFVFIDRITNNTVGAGLIVEKGESKYISWHKHKVTKEERSKIKGHKPCILWFTGLSGSGKSTIANALEEILNRKGYHTYLLDGDNIRHGLNKNLGFSAEDRKENIRRIGEVSKLFVDAGLIVITAFISPFKEEREFARSLVNENEFIEVFVDTPLETCEERDPKGLYKKAREGKIKEFTGISSPYETPEMPDIHIRTNRLTIDESVEKILTYLEQNNII